MLLHAAADSALHVEDRGTADGSHRPRVAVPAVPYKDLATARAAESSEIIRGRVSGARNVQLRRFYDEPHLHERVMKSAKRPAAKTNTFKGTNCDLEEGVQFS